MKYLFGNLKIFSFVLDRKKDYKKKYLFEIRNVKTNAKYFLFKTSIFNWNISVLFWYSWCAIISYMYDYIINYPSHLFFIFNDNCDESSAGIHIPDVPNIVATFINMSFALIHNIYSCLLFFFIFTVYSAYKDHVSDCFLGHYK